MRNLKIQLLVTVLAAGAAPAYGADIVTGGFQGCRDPDAPSAIVAMPAPLPVFSGQSEHGSCLRFTTGSDYQRLDWLENGKVDAALLSPFALSLLQESAEREFCALKGPFSGIAPHRYVLRRVDGDAPQADPRTALLSSLGDAKSEVPIVLDSHLSDGLLQLVEATAGWLREEGATAFEPWRRFRDRLRFTRPLSPAGGPGYFEVARVDDRGGAACDDPAAACLSAEPDTDYLVARRASLPATLGESACRPTPLAPWEERLPPEWDKGHPMADFLRHSLEPHPRGFLTRRHYRFTLDEVWAILGEKGSQREAGGLSLVLTGGGVKAAYQTEVIDHLYRQGYLYNRPEWKPERGRPLLVKSVVGTSGGALLGVFVAAIDWRLEKAAEMPKSLVETLWKPGGKHLDSGDIFPGIDMLRFASRLWSGLVFGGVCVLALLAERLLRRLRRRTGAVGDPLLQEIPKDARDGGRLRWSTAPWLALLGLSPWVIKGVTGETGLEHIPAVSGFFYSAYIFVAIYSDQATVFETKPEVPDRLRSTLALCAVAGVLTIGPFLIPSDHPLRQVPFELPTLGFVTLPTIVVSAGFLVLAWAIHRSAAARANLIDLRKLSTAGGLLVFVPLVVYGLILLTGLETFELNPRFWVWLTAAVAAGTTLTFVLGRWQRAPRWLRERIAAGLDVLLAEHPSRSLLGMRRSSRALLCFSFAWLWWNFVNAPALYGNERAKGYFQQTLAAFAEVGEVDEEACHIEFHAPLIITATSLGRGREVYFLVEPGAAGALASRPEIASDPRWVSVGPAVTNRNLGALAFASGSPFPVFPMTRVDPTPIAGECPVGGDHPSFDPHGNQREWLIDGGYAHNMPIDAARQLGASRVLVLSSSPMHQTEPGDHHGEDDSQPWRPSPLSIGRLVMGAPRLIPYLYTRSQVEDTLGTEDLLVAALSPVLPQGEGWPLLVDFYEEPLKRVIKRARSNLRENARIGTIESWGRPVCRLGEVAVACSELRRQPPVR